MIVAGAALVLTVPSVAAAAGPWTVRDAAGKKIGYASSDGSPYVDSKNRVWGPKRIKRAWLEYQTQMAWVTRCKTSTGSLPSAYVQEVGSSGWWMGPVSSDYPPAWRGRVRKLDGRWVASLKVNGKWKARGSVTSECPAWLAGGAVYILLGKQWR